MGKATGKQRQPSFQALIPTAQLVAVRAFTTANRISEAAALTALLAYALEHHEEIEWRINMPTIVEPGSPIEPPDARQQELLLPAPRACSAQRGKFSPRRDLANATNNQVQRF